MWYWNPRHYLKQLSGPRFYHLSNEWVELYDIRTGYVERGRQNPVGKLGQRGCPRADPLAGSGRPRAHVLLKSHPLPFPVYFLHKHQKGLWSTLVGGLCNHHPSPSSPHTTPGGAPGNPAPCPRPAPQGSWEFHTWQIGLGPQRLGPILWLFQGAGGRESR